MGEGQTSSFRRSIFSGTSTLPVRGARKLKRRRVAPAARCLRLIRGLERDLSAERDSVVVSIVGEGANVVEVDILVVDHELQRIVRIEVQPHAPDVLGATEEAISGNGRELVVVQVRAAITCGRFPGAPI